MIVGFSESSDTLYFMKDQYIAYLTRYSADKWVITSSNFMTVDLEFSSFDLAYEVIKDCLLMETLTQP